MKKVEAYRCEHCGKLFMRDYNCRKHEPQCTKNPLVRPLCYDCKFYDPASYEDLEEVKIWYDDGFGGDYTTKKFAPNKCSHPKKGCKLFANIHMGEDIKRLLMCDAAHFCEGWRDSDGCLLEFNAAQIYDITRYVNINDIPVLK